MINSILENIQEFTESNGGRQYRGTVSHLEEKLYLLELMLSKFTNEQAKKFYRIALRLISVKIIDGNISCACKSNHILILYMLIKIDKTFPNFRLDNHQVKEKYYKLVNLHMAKFDEIHHVHNLLEYEMYNGMQIIDAIAHEEMIKLLDNPKVISVITDFWRGPYERQWFIEESFTYKIMIKTFTDTGTFFNYNPERENGYSWARHL